VSYNLRFLLQFVIFNAVVLSCIEMASTILCAVCTTGSGRFSNRHSICYVGVLFRQEVASQIWINRS